MNDLIRKLWIELKNLSDESLNSGVDMTAENLKLWEAVTSHSAIQSHLKQDRLEEDYKKLIEVINPYLRDEDGSDLIPNHVRVANMLDRLYS